MFTITTPEVVVGPCILGGGCYTNASQRRKVVILLITSFKSPDFIFYANVDLISF